MERRLTIIGILQTRPFLRIDPTQVIVLLRPFILGTHSTTVASAQLPGTIRTMADFFETQKLPQKI